MFIVHLYIVIVIDFTYRYEFICAPLVHPLFKREFIFGKAKNRAGPFTRPDIVLCSSGKGNQY